MESALGLQTSQGPVTWSWPRVRGSYLNWFSLSVLLHQDTAGLLAWQNVCVC